MIAGIIILLSLAVIVQLAYIIHLESKVEELQKRGKWVERMSGMRARVRDDFWGDE